MVVALIVRGQIARWGCSDSARLHQSNVLHSLDLHVAEPLFPVRVDAYLTLSLGHESCTWWTHEKVSSHWKYLHLRYMRYEHSNSQRASIQRALALASVLKNVSTIVLTRSDLTVKTPITTWGCSVHHLNAVGISQSLVANPMNPLDIVNEKRDIINDVLFVIPYWMLATLNVKSCQQLQGDMHLCRKVFAELAPIEFCWPRNIRYVRCPSPFYTLPQCDNVDNPVSHNSFFCTPNGKLKFKCD